MKHCSDSQNHESGKEYIIIIIIIILLTLVKWSSTFTFAHHFGLKYNLEKNCFTSINHITINCIHSTSSYKNTFQHTSHVSIEQPWNSLFTQTDEKHNYRFHLTRHNETDVSAEYLIHIYITDQTENFTIDVVLF